MVIFFGNRGVAKCPVFFCGLNSAPYKKSTGKTLVDFLFFFFRDYFLPFISLILRHQNFPTFQQAQMDAPPRAIVPTNATQNGAMASNQNNLMKMTDIATKSTVMMVPIVSKICITL